MLLGGPRKVSVYFAQTLKIEMPSDIFGVAYFASLQHVQTYIRSIIQHIILWKLLFFI